MVDLHHGGKVALLVPRGLERAAFLLLRRDAAVEGGLQLWRRLWRPTTTGLGRAGGCSVLLSSSAHHREAVPPPPPALFACPCVDAALAVVAACGDVDASASDPVVLLRGCGIDARSVLAATRTLSRYRRLPATPSFRVATLRGGRHSPAVTCLSVNVAVADALVAAQEEGQPSRSSWVVDLERPDVLVVVLLLQSSLLVGLLLPPFVPRRSAVLPRCPRAYLTDPATCGYFSPSRAACLALLAGLRRGEVLLDPCGGVGVIPIECALVEPGLKRAISLDNDPRATGIARGHAAAALTSARGCAPLEVVLGDALSTGLAAGSVDVVISDLPFGNRHGRLDVGALLAELWRVLSPSGGRAILVVKAQDKPKLERAARSHSRKKPWLNAGTTAFSSGGIDVVAVMFVREGPPCPVSPPPPPSTNDGSALAELGRRIARLEAGDRDAAERLGAVHAAVEGFKREKAVRIKTI